MTPSVADAMKKGGAILAKAPPLLAIQARTERNEARSSAVKAAGCSHAAKWPP
ncbi:MAG: hypothetical protein K0S00_1121, partial [Xanthobacteraceae bacterium]|nr:hypothetical protein [Xanthobacteraceae bacterium]